MIIKVSFFKNVGQFRAIGMYVEVDRIVWDTLSRPTVYCLCVRLWNHTFSIHTSED
jgi:hypothetical protein